MTEISEEDKQRILKTLDAGGRIGYRTKFLAREMDLSVNSRRLAKMLTKWSEVEPRDSETRPPWNWILKRNSVAGTPNQV